LIEIKQPDAIKGSALDFLGEARAQVQAIHESFIRPETGVYSYPALMYFMEYELHRYEAYNFPLSLIVFEIKNRRDGSSTSDVLTSQAAGIAAMRIDLVKRPLDIIGHFEAVDYGLLLPNTTGSSAAFVANRILESLTATPLVKGVDRNSLELAFGIACLPADGDDMESLVMSAKAAKAKAKNGQFPIVLSRSKKSN
jgi:GGDEF domain-containing protein